MQETCELIGIRIHRARQAAGLSLRELADQVGISHTQIANFEKGKTTPDSRDLLQIADTVGMRFEWFLRPVQRELKEVSFRKRKRLQRKDQEAIQAHVLDHFERRLEVESLFPKPPICNFESPAMLPHKLSSLDQVEAVADEVRSAWNLGLSPIPDLTDLCESHGMRVFAIGIESKDFDGLAGTVEDWPIVVFSNGDNWPGDRQRFTLAHELGHRLLDDHLTDDVDEEKAANRFAAAFLFPGSAVRKAVFGHRTAVDIRELMLLKQEWGVSIACIVGRMIDLDILDKKAAISFWKKYRKNYWHRKEPGEALPPEEVHTFASLVYVALAEGFIGESKAAELMGESLDEFRMRSPQAFHEGAGAGSHK